ncbi:hypothetical protein VUR80DRAFT_5835 [Thermomyces stellatus]
MGANVTKRRVAAGGLFVRVTPSDQSWQVGLHSPPGVCLRPAGRGCSFGFWAPRGEERGWLGKREEEKGGVWWLAANLRTGTNFLKLAALGGCAKRRWRSIVETRRLLTIVRHFIILVGEGASLSPYLRVHRPGTSREGRSRRPTQKHWNR